MSDSAQRLDRPAITVVVAEDQGMILDAFTRLLALQADVVVVGRAPDGDAALELVRELTPDVLVTDIEMPGLTGLELAEQIAEDTSETRVVILTTFARAGYLRRALDALVAGYILKAAPIEDLVQALRTVRAGGRVIDPELAVMAWDEAVELTDRERAVLRLAEDGHPNRDIAQTLHLAEGTVRNYVSEAMGKLGARNRGEAATLARDRGLL